MIASNRWRVLIDTERAKDELYTGNTDTITYLWPRLRHFYFLVYILLPGVILSVIHLIWHFCEIVSELNDFNDFNDFRIEWFQWFHLLTSSKYCFLSRKTAFSRGKLSESTYCLEWSWVSFISFNIFAKSFQSWMISMISELNDFNDFRVEWFQWFQSWMISVC